MCDGKIWINGYQGPVDAQVKPFTDTKLEFVGHERTLPVDWIVLHWTASERTGDKGAEKIFRSLGNRNLSVEFFVDNDGIIYQFLDPGTRHARHAGTVNKSSVGIEVSCYGWAKKTPRAGAARELYVDEIQGRNYSVANYFIAQQAAVNALCDTLTRELDVPRVALGAPYAKRTLGNLRRNRGVVGHMHVSSQKVDPGTRPLESMGRYFKEVDR